MEVLSPLRDPNDVEALVAAGADALYCGLAGLSSRPRGADLTLEEVAHAADCCKELKRPLYVAINGCLDQERLERAKRGALEAERLSASALIVADWGLSRFCLGHLTSAEVHISTLAGVQNSATARLLHELGARRVVLSSNLTLTEIAEIVHAVPGLDYEIVAEGGVCFNDNRLCELPHSASDGAGYRVGCKRTYTYRADDRGETPARTIGGSQASAERLVALFSAMGVDSLKIEGRTRDRAWALESTARLRRAVDEVQEPDPGLLHYVSRLREADYPDEGGH